MIHHQRWDGEEENNNNMGVYDKIFFDLEVSSNNDENSEHQFLDVIFTGVNFWKLLATFLLEWCKRVLGVACEFVVWCSMWICCMPAWKTFEFFEFVSIQRIDWSSKKWWNRYYPRIERLNFEFTNQ